MDDGKIMLEEFHLVGNRIEARFALDAAKEIAGCFLALCDEHGAQNYLEMQMHDKSGRGVTVTVRRIEGKTPHQLRQEADAKVIDLTAELEAVRRDAEEWREHFIHVSAMRYMDAGMKNDGATVAARQDAAIIDAARQQEATNV